jgi:hypothetical protein
MAWLMLVGLIVIFVFAHRFARHRRSLFTMLPSESISTFHVEISRRQTAKTRAALDAATASLR